jgi:hypothetical protein
VRQRDQHDEAARAFDQRRHGAHALAHEEVAFPMAGHGTVVGFGRPFTDVEHAAQLALTVHHRVAPRPARRMPRAERAGQFFA